MKTKNKSKKRSADTLTFWLNSAGRHPLLPSETMISLSKTIQEHGADSVIGRRAVNKIVKHNLRLVPLVVQRLTSMKKFSHFGDRHTLDLLQAGTFGLTRAAQKFDYSRGYKFSTYAYGWIRQRVQRAMHALNSLLHVPEAYFRYQSDMSDSPDFWQKVKSKGEKTFNTHLSAHRALCPTLSLERVMHEGDQQPRYDPALTTKSLVVIDSVQDIFDLVETPIEALHQKLVVEVCCEDMSISQSAEKNGIDRHVASKIIKATLQQLKEAYKEGLVSKP